MFLLNMVDYPSPPGFFLFWAVGGGVIVSKSLLLFEFLDVIVMLWPSTQSSIQNPQSSVLNKVRWSLGVKFQIFQSRLGEGKVRVR